MVSGAVYVLRPMQSGYALLERNRAIVGLAGLSNTPSQLPDAALVQAFLDLDARVLDLQTGQFVAGLNGHAFDHWRETLADLPDDQRTVPDSRIVPVYFARRNGALERLVLPVHGQGMWSTIYGYVALEADLNTIAGVVFHRHGETPGIGDRIQDPAWLASWRGKQIYDRSGSTQIRVARRGVETDVHQIDLITGASVTSEAVGRFVNDWFGVDGYGPWLGRLQQAPGSPGR